MTIEHSWRVAGLNASDADGYESVVKGVALEITASNGTNSASVNLSQQLDPPGVTFVAFDEITEDLVVSWVKEKLGAENVASIELMATQELEASLTPPVSLPWISQ
jgi:hypothetical protein